MTNCYNSGQVGTAGIAEDMRDWNMRVINCYNAGSLVKSYYDYNYQDTIGNYHGTNVYSATEYCNSSYTTVVSMDELKSSDMISRIKGDDVLNKWCLDEHLLNKGLMIPLAQDDLYSGEYKVLPVINSVKDKVTVNISDGEYQLEGIIDALYGTKKQSLFMTLNLRIFLLHQMENYTKEGWYGNCESNFTGNRKYKRV